MLTYIFSHFNREAALLENIFKKCEEVIQKHYVISNDLETSINVKLTTKGGHAYIHPRNRKDTQTASIAEPRKYNNMRFNIVDPATGSLPFLIHEYKAFSDDPICGSVLFEESHSDNALILAALHEFAHLTHIYLLNWHGDEKPHGSAFKNVYRILRQEVLPLFAIGKYRAWQGPRLFRTSQGYCKMGVAESPTRRNKVPTLLPMARQAQLIGYCYQNQAVELQFHLPNVSLTEDESTFSQWIRG